MSRKHFSYIARTIAIRLSMQPNERVCLRAIAEDLSREFARDCSAFNQSRFIAACGF